MRNYKEYQKLIKNFTNLESNYYSYFSTLPNFTKTINLLHQHHSNNCEEYKKLSIMEMNSKFDLGKIPILPVELFKKFDLKSYETDVTEKILKSSGTSGFNSKI